MSLGIHLKNDLAFNQRMLKRSLDDVHCYADRIVYRLEEVAKTRPLTENEDHHLTQARHWRAVMEEVQ